MVLSKENFYLWKMDPVGQEFFAAIRQVRDRWVEALVTDDNLDVSKARGVILGLDHVLEFSVED